MTGALLGVAFGVTFAAVALVASFAFQLFRQNGRILKRLDALERDAADRAAGRPASFGSRDLAKSRLKRDGLRPGTKAPAFTLPALDGGTVSLDEYLGRRVLLVFSDPQCGPCETLAPLLERRAGQTTDVSVVMVSRGELELNRRKIAQYGLTFPVVLQRQWEVSRDYAMFATPIAYLIDERGVIEAPVAAGTDRILSLLAAARQSAAS